MLVREILAQIQTGPHDTYTRAYQKFDPGAELRPLQKKILTDYTEAGEAPRLASFNLQRGAEPERARPKHFVCVNGFQI